MKPSVRLRHPGDLVATIPYQLGYRPEHSLVVIALRAGRIGPIARLDLPEPARPGAGAEASANRAVRAAVAALLEVLDEHADTIAVLWFESHAGESGPMRDALRAAADRLALTVSTCVVVHGGRWVEIDPLTGRACPEGSHPVPADREVPAIAEFVALGVNPLASRRALVESVATQRDWALSVRRHRPATIDDPLRLWARWLGEPAVAADAASLGVREGARIARLLATLADRDLRDALIAGLCPGALPLGELPGPLARGVTHRLQPALERCDPPQIHARLVRVLRAAPPGSVAPIATVTACHMWWVGDGALARVCVERALAEDPSYRLATLLEAMLDAGIAPGRERQARTGHDLGRTS